ncbi:hypothetical protein BX616_006479 [Lobosporangium transversale]|nr:hypothetical protein BX616_006479 [Lobosporangium transversale]
MPQFDSVPLSSTITQEIDSNNGYEDDDDNEDDSLEELNQTSPSNANNLEEQLEGGDRHKDLYHMSSNNDDPYITVDNGVDKDIDSDDYHSVRYNYVGADDNNNDDSIDNSHNGGDEDGSGDGDTDSGNTYEGLQSEDERDENYSAEDPIYVADILRQCNIDWLQYPEYASHRLIVVKDMQREDNHSELQQHRISTFQQGQRQSEGECNHNHQQQLTTELQSQLPQHQSNDSDGFYYCYVMAQFLSSASAVFRDFFLVHREDSSNNEEINHNRLNCLRWIPESEACQIPFPLEQSPGLSREQLRQPQPPSSPLASNVMGLLNSKAYKGLDGQQGESRNSSNSNNNGNNNSNNNEREEEGEEDGNYRKTPLLELCLPYPNHFEGLLRVMYDMDLERWTQENFSSDTIGEVFENVCRLECSTYLTLHCLKYFGAIKTMMSREQLARSSMRQLQEIYKRALDSNLLTLDE